jgi:hypothetical protein
MPTTTTNNAWPIPLDSDPFKDGALAMRNLGNGIDTSIGNSLKAWTSYTPVVSPATGVFFVLTINHAVYWRIGKTCHVNLQYTMTSVGSAAGLISFTLPFTAKRTNSGIGAGREVAATGSMLQIGFYGGSTTSVGVARYDNAASVGASYSHVISLTYEVA